MSPRSTATESVPTGRETGVALLVAALWVLGVDLVTNGTPPLWDAVSYVDVAQNGLAGNEHLVAPFAYRPGVPLLARAVAGLLGVDVLVGFDVVTRTALVATLFLAWRFARALSLAAGAALGLQAVVALSFFHLKLPLFFPTLVDAGAYPFLLGALLAIARRRFAAALAVALVGLAFKEFLLVPLGVLAWQAARERRFGRAGLVVLATAFVFLGLRAAIPVERSQQFVDLSSLENVWIYLRWVPLRWERDVNVVFSVASYFLPCLLLVTHERWRAWRAGPIRAAAPWGLALGLVLLLTLYGGTNVSTFVSYGLPVQLAVLAAFATAEERPIGRAELVLALVALGVFNRVGVLLPVPRAELAHADSLAYLDVYAGWGSRLSSATLARAIELVAWIALLHVVRRATPRRG
ncbi:MAG: hypothetical protein IPJ77_13140 [Planctomycetes bacterium]|nr:hypothetical protein [Planctomycetota bacterium]